MHYSTKLIQIVVRDVHFLFALFLSSGEPTIEADHATAIGREMGICTELLPLLPTNQSQFLPAASTRGNNVGRFL